MDSITEEMGMIFKKQVLELAASEHDVRTLNRRLIEYIVVADEETEAEMKELVVQLLLFCRQNVASLDAISSAMALAIYMTHNPDSPMCMIDGAGVSGLPRFH